MTRQPARIAIEIGSACVRAAAQTEDGVACAQSAVTGEAIDAAIAAVAKELGARSGRAVCAVPRTDTVVKTVALPEGGLPDHEVASFVRLQMERQLPFPSEHAVVDFVEAPHATPALLAAAIRDDSLERARAAMAKAGFRRAGVTLVDEGLARLLAPIGERGVGVIGVFATSARCEIVIARDGRLLMSRACDLPDDPGDARAVVVTEARRTLMSYRVRPDSVEVGAGALLCAPGDRGALAAALEPAIDLGAIEPVRTGAHEDADPACARLAGSLALGEAHLDFSDPTTAPDRFARTRQLAMLAILVVIVIVGGAITLGLREKRALSADLETARSDLGKANARALGLIRTAARLDHARAWRASGVDWNAHLEIVGGALPPADAALLDRLSMSADPILTYENDRSRPYSAERWTVGARIGIGVTASTKDQATVRALRERLIAMDTYTLTPVGDDAGASGEGAYPVVTGFTLTSSERTPRTSGADGGGDG